MLHIQLMPTRSLRYDGALLTRAAMAAARCFSSKRRSSSRNTSSSSSAFCASSALRSSASTSEMSSIISSRLSGRAQLIWINSTQASVDEAHVLHALHAHVQVAGGPCPTCMMHASALHTCIIDIRVHIENLLHILRLGHNSYFKCFRRILKFLLTYSVSRKLSCN